ncbi:MAG TPA: protein-methionine-sulfoxide reductase catalytic subunit MsrP, partial [Arenibaculum sp.]|nr:protein-methionine-sulfoxide reductase catalytic subunit MsrP [Arenibaculum sp.]
MLIKRRRGWELPETAATPEHVYVGRRSLLAAGGAVGVLAAASPFVAGPSFAAEAEDPSAGLYPVARNDRFELDRPLTDEAMVTTYNNF